MLPEARGDDGALPSREPEATGLTRLHCKIARSRNAIRPTPGRPGEPAPGGPDRSEDHREAAPEAEGPYPSASGRWSRAPASGPVPGRSTRCSKCQPSKWYSGLRSASPLQRQPSFQHRQLTQCSKCQPSKWYSGLRSASPSQRQPSFQRLQLSKGSVGPPRTQAHSGGFEFVSLLGSPRQRFQIGHIRGAARPYHRVYDDNIP
jgi:hypothetical protein